MPKEKRRFDTEVQYIKYKVLKEVARRKWDGNLFETIFEIPKIIAPGGTPAVRCCIYKERAIVEERYRLVYWISSPIRSLSARSSLRLGTRSAHSTPKPRSLRLLL